MNELLYFISAILVFFTVSLIARLFGKKGMYAWIAIATIFANIALAKQVTMFGLQVTLGNIMFSSVYLATDIMSEVYGRKESQKSVFAGLIAALVFVGFGIIVNAMRPNELDFASDALNTLLSFSARATSMSILFFFLSNLADVWLFDKFRQHSTKNLWLRNNVCTILCNCVENFLFIFAAFYGIMSANDCLMIAITSSVMEVITGLLDTPFVYLGRKWAIRENNP